MRLIDAEPVERLVNKKLEEKEERSISSYSDGWCEGAKFVLSEIEHTASIRLCQNCKRASRIKKTQYIYCDRYEKVKSKNGYCDLAERRTDEAD